MRWQELSDGSFKLLEKILSEFRKFVESTNFLEAISAGYAVNAGSEIFSRLESLQQKENFLIKGNAERSYEKI